MNNSIKSRCLADLLKENYKIATRLMVSGLGEYRMELKFSHKFVFVLKAQYQQSFDYIIFNNDTTSLELKH